MIQRTKGANSTPYIITVCGSFRFLPVMLKAHHELSRQGFMVFMPDFPLDEIPTGETAADPEAQELQDAKISFGDAVFICNVDGYIGESTFHEWKLAKKLKKDIIWLMRDDEEAMEKTRERLRELDHRKEN